MKFASRYKEVLGVEPPIGAVIALIMAIVMFAFGCIAIGYALAKYF